MVNQHMAAMQDTRRIIRRPPQRAVLTTAMSLAVMDWGRHLYQTVSHLQSYSQL
jgi:hypothetical protein